MSQKDLVPALLAALEKDPDINLHESPIRVTYHDSLRLEGEVANIIVKRKARRIAMQISGLNDIEDRLLLRPGERRHGKALMDAVTSALSQEPAFRDMAVHTHPATEIGGRDWIGVDVAECVVRLDGQVRSLSHRRLAEVITWWVPGSCDVHNHMRVKPAEKDNDDEISDAVSMVLEKDPLLHAETLSVHTHNREVTLSGVVHSDEQRRMAIYDCWYVPGVHEVHDRMQVQG
jgi:osmotically-inducible protein OsmY